MSRTVGEDRLVDEMIFSFTHTQPVPWMLPGVALVSRQMPPSSPSSSLPLASKATAWWSACGPLLPLAPVLMSVQVAPPLVLSRTLLVPDAPAAKTMLALEGSTARVVSYQPWPPM